MSHRQKLQGLGLAHELLERERTELVKVDVVLLQVARDILVQPLGQPDRARGGELPGLTVDGASDCRLSTSRVGLVVCVRCHRRSELKRLEQIFNGSSWRLFATHSGIPTRFDQRFGQVHSPLAQIPVRVWLFSLSNWPEPWIELSLSPRTSV